MAAATMPDRRAALERDGFVVVKSVVGTAELEALRVAAREAEALGRAGAWPHTRTVGKQFPPWQPDPARGIWGVQHLMNPALPGSRAFARLYFSDEVLGLARQLLRCADDDLVMELLNTLVRPDRDFELRWHRDDVPADASPALEMDRLARPTFHTQYNLALWPDDSLVLVPGSHRHPRTDVERAAAPLEKALPGQLVVVLEPGDMAFYENNILHRGVYDCFKPRLTLHGSVGHVAGGRLRARNVLQHGVGDWVARVDLSDLTNAERRCAEGMRDRLIKLGRESGDV